jgi:hypothetical protein
VVFSALKRTVAIMQPYFIPYAGYFRLFEVADLFVALDCAQFPRRGWVHRNRLIGSDGESRWITLPIRKASRDTRINDIRLTADSLAHLERQTRRFPALSAPSCDAAQLAGAIMRRHDSLVECNLELIETATSQLGLTRPIVRSSSLALPPGVTGQERIIAIAHHFAARIYVNAPGGRDLYDQKAFLAAGMELRFLPPYEGAMTSILQRLHDDGTRELRREILKNTRTL